MFDSHSQDLMTPEKATEAVVPTSPIGRVIRRSVGRMIDYFLFAPLVLANIYLPPAMNSLLLSVVMQIITLAAIWAYFPLCHWRFGRTVGKGLMKLSVRTEGNLSFLSLQQAIAREYLWMVVVPITIFLEYKKYTLLFGGVYDTAHTRQALLQIGKDPSYILWDKVFDWYQYLYHAVCLLMIFFDLQGRAPHDYVAHSVVVGISKKTPKSINGA